MNKGKENTLKNMVKDLSWMAIRYANRWEDEDAFKTLEKVLGKYNERFSEMDIMPKETPEDYEGTLKEVIEVLIPMAIRYANNRQTLAPHMVRYFVKNYKELYPEFVLEPDASLEPLDDSLELLDEYGWGIEGDNLLDLFEVKK